MHFVMSVCLLLSSEKIVGHPLRFVLKEYVATVVLAVICRNFQGFLICF